MSEEEEFKEISRLILKPTLSIDELDELAERWALNSLRMRERYGLPGPEESPGELVERYRERIMRLRQRLGLGAPEEAP